jgi:hypothetical protein
METGFWGIPLAWSLASRSDTRRQWTLVGLDRGIPDATVN